MLTSVICLGASERMEYLDQLQPVVEVGFEPDTSEVYPLAFAETRLGRVEKVRRGRSAALSLRLRAGRQETARARSLWVEQST